MQDNFYKMNSINTTDFRFSMVLPIRWNDLDPLNHVNNVFYFEYFQVGRGHYMLTASKQWDWTKNMFVIAHIECDYYKELKLTAKDMKKMKLIDEIIKEPLGGAHRDKETTYLAVQKAIIKAHDELKKLSPEKLVEERMNKYANMGEYKD